MLPILSKHLARLPIPGRTTLIAFAWSALCFFPVANGQYADAIDIPFTRYTLDNGLTLLVHKDHKAPIVTVNVWYHVGSKDESPGKTGFAHLFEHLMFNGSENYNDEWFLPLQKAGGTDLNGTTWFDRTNYFQNVPTPALDMVLWMESDRMGHFINAVTQQRLDEQRDVVKNEKRQGDNAPYGKSQYLQLAGMFPEGHPYRWSTIGSMADLDAASLEDVRTWFATYYGTANATLVIAGDVEPAQVLEKVRHYFGDIAAGPALEKTERWIAKRHESRRDVMYDEVSQSRLTKAWNTPPFGDADNSLLELVAAIVGQGKSSRLYQRLVLEEQLASSVSASQQGFEIAGMFELEIYLKPGADMSRVETIVDEELNRFISKGPSKQELARVKTRLLASRIRALEKIGGFTGKAQTLARYQTYLGDAGFYKVDLQRLEEASSRQLKQAARQWLASGDYNLEVHPQPSFASASSGADRSRLPDAGEVPQLKLAVPEEFYLGNGLRVLLSERDAIPVTNIALQFNAGFADDSRERLGLASITAEMLDEGTEQLDASTIAEQVEVLGAIIDSRASLDTTTVSLSALNANLSASLALFADVVRRPTFPERELTRVKSNWLDRIEQEKSSPFSLALRRLPPLLYGEEHAYGIPFTGSGYSASVARIDRADLQRFHAEYLQPANATLIVVGAVDKATIEPLLERYLGGWKNSGPTAKASPPDGLADNSADNPVERPELPDSLQNAGDPVIYLVDKPGAPQSLILGGQLMPTSAWPESYKLEMASRILGGSFTSRINMNLREEKGWAYGARTMLPAAQGLRPLLYYAPVQSDKTAESLRELIDEADRFGSSRPPASTELARFKSSFVRGLPGKFETNRAVVSALADMVEFQRPLNYIELNQAQVSNLEVQDIVPVIQQYIRSEQTVWLIVGDLAKMETAVRELGVAEVRVLEK